MKKLGLFFIILQFVLLNYIYAVNISSFSFLCEVEIGKLQTEELEILHTDITKVYGLNNQITLELKIKNASQQPVVTINYKTPSDTEVKSKSAVVTEEGNNVYVAKYIVPGTEISNIGTFKYAFKIVVDNKTKYIPSNIAIDNDFVALNIAKSFEIEKVKDDYISNTGVLKNIIFDSGHNAIENFRMTIPANTFVSVSTVTITQKKTDESGVVEKITANDKVLSVYDFTSTPLVSGDFNNLITVKVAYPDQENNNKVDTLGDNYYAQNLRAFYYNTLKNKWEMVGGIVDTQSKTVTFQIKHFSLYAIMHTIINKDTFRPNIRIITPNGDGYNDKTEFLNMDTDKPEIKIYDVNGRLVRTIAKEPYEWDGRDNTGRIVESGVYIYQFKVDINGKKEYVSGTLAIAK